MNVRVDARVWLGGADLFQGETVDGTSRTVLFSVGPEDAKALEEGISEALGDVMDMPFTSLEPGQVVHVFDGPMGLVSAGSVVAGTRFLEVRGTEAYRVQAVCDRGSCSHEERDRYSVHVRDLDRPGHEWFSAHHDGDLLAVTA